MRVCGLGGPELVILAMLLFVVFGPERTQQVALSAGRFLRRMMQSEWWGDFARLTKEIRDLPATLVRLAELEETQAELEKSLADLQGEIDVGLQRDVTTDPWGIENAVAGTVRPQEEPPSPSVRDDEPANDLDGPTDSAP
jgi:Sec-independent protein translocase protein TatA